MTLRTPLILISGAYSQLPTGDSVPGTDAAAQASGNAALVVAAAADANASAALASGNAALVDVSAALASGNAGIVDAGVALASGNAALAYADTKLPASGGTLDGQLTQNIVALGLYGSGLNCALGNYFTATISGDSTVVISGVPSSVAYSLVYEVQHDTGTITWPTEVEWPSDTAPTLTTGKTHVFIFITDDGGSRWRAASLVDYDT